jgi:PAS domain S-box-containing protein
MKPLRVLIVEDSEQDAALLLRELRKSGYDAVHRRVETHKEMTDALSSEHWDIVLSDYVLPDFGGLAAIRTVKQSDPDLPLIIISGRIGEDTAVEAMKAGAQDYIIKGNLRRLGPAIERELVEAENRRQRTKAEKEVAFERQRLFDVFEALPAMVCLLTPDYHVAFANRSFRRQFGESQGRHCYEYFFGKAEPCDFCQSREVLKTGKPRQWEITIPESGTVIDVYDYPFTDVDGSLMILKMDIDITEQREVEAALRELNETLEKRVAERTADLSRSEEQFRRAIEEAPIPVIMQAEDGQVLQISHSWTELTGYTPEDIPTFEAWLNRAYAEGADEVRRQVHSLFDGDKRSIDIEFPIRTTKGESRYWSFSASAPGALADGRRFVVGMGVDITERKKTEEIKDEFIGLVSHELRTPLTVVIGALATAMDKRVSRADKEELLKDASSGAESLAGILDNMLELSRYQAGRLKLDRKAIRIGDIAAKAAQRVRRKYGTHDIVVDVPEEIPMVNADAVRIEQVLYNLIENAVKYSPAGSRVRVFSQHGKTGTVVGVSDSGVGISSEDQRKLFEPFARLERSGGTGVGLGLVVCKRLVEAHGGRLWIESQPGKGSTFLFTIPSARV